MALFILASLGWAYFFITDTLQLWHAMALLVIHGCAGVLWQGASQMLLHDIVPAPDLGSAVRLLATARTLGVLVGPAVGGAIMLTIGPRYGLLLNALFFLPNLLWLWKAPYGPRFRAAPAAPPRAVRGLADITRTLAEVRSDRLLASMILLAGLRLVLRGQQLPGADAGLRARPGPWRRRRTYSMLLAADAAGALLAGLLLESRAGLLPTTPRTALVLAMLWCCALAGFAATASYPLALVLLFAAGVCELAFSSIAGA
jgi:hypothetical protein